MGFAEDEVRKYILRNLPRFQGVRLNQLLPHLPCLTSADRQEITRELDRRGDISTVYEFFDRLCCRTGWVIQLISAYRATNSDLAEVIQKVYEDAQLPSQRRPPGAQRRPPGAQRRPPSDDPPLSYEQSPSRPIRAHPPKSVDAVMLPPSAPFQDQVDIRSQIPESKHPSGNDMTATEGKALGKISAPDEHDRNSAEPDGSLPGHHENPSSVQVASPRSPVQPRMHLRDASEAEMQTAKPESSRSEPGNLVPNWDGFQPSPVCVKNGYFGNMNRSVDRGIAPAPDLATSSGLTPSRNQPEEDSYLSSGCSPLAPRGQDTEQGEEQDFLGNTANNRSLRLHIQVDEEQKRAQGQQDSNSDVNTLPLLLKEGDRHSQRVNSRTVDGREIPSGVVPKGSAFVNLQKEAKTLPPSVPSETTTASNFERDSLSAGSEKESHDHNLCCEATSGVDQLSEGCMAASGGNTDDLETRETPQRTPSLGRSPSDGSRFPPRSSIEENAGQVPNTASVGRFASLSPDFAGFSSTGVIPPSSHAAGSAIPRDEYSDYLKPPVQETEAVDTGVRTASVRMTGGSSPTADTLPSSVMDSPANSRENRNNAGGHSRDARIYHSNQEEESASLFKPGVLVSEDRTRRPPDQPPSSLGGEYSGTSARLRLSGGYSGNSDSLMMSRSEQFGRNASAGGSRASVPLQNGDCSDEGSIQTHSVHIQEPPPVLLTGAPEVTRPALGNASQSPDDFLDAVAGDQPMTDASSRTGHNDGGRKSLWNESTNGSVWLPIGSTWLAVGVAFAVLTAVAVVGYQRLKK